MVLKPLKKVQAFLTKHRTIGIDTSIFIYWIESHPTYKDFVEPIFLWLDKPHSVGVTSSVTMLEVLVKPYQESRFDLVYEFFSILSNYPTLRFIDVTLSIANLAAKLRAEIRLKTPDAIQAASALSFGVTGFVSNDPDFKRIPNLDVLILKEL